MEESDAPSKVKTNELFADEVNRMAQLHLRFALCVLTQESIDQYDFKDKKIPELTRLALRVFCLKELMRDNQFLYESGFFAKGANRLMT